MDERQQKPNFAFRVLIFKDGKVLLGKNLGAFAPGKFGPPGGHLEYLESFENCAKRESMEECGVEIANIQFQSIVNSTEFKPYHNISIMLIADWKNGEPKAIEPSKTESWNWYDLENLPSPLFKNVKLALENLKTGKSYFDIND